MNIERFSKGIRGNIFSIRSGEAHTIFLKRFFPSVTLYREDFEKKAEWSIGQLIKAMTPEFQRANTKWSREMQIAFVENVVAGFRCELMLYHVASESLGSSNSFILDGLQRMTAIQAFTEGEIDVYGASYHDLIVNKKISGTITLKIYEFSSHVAACRHYIGMNKNITHSPEDLETAYSFLAKANLDTIETTD